MAPKHSDAKIIGTCFGTMPAAFSLPNESDAITADAVMMATIHPTYSEECEQLSAVRSAGKGLDVRDCLFFLRS